MKKIFTKALTVLGSAALVGSTIGIAAAAAYPAGFTSNTAIVVGSNAAPSDNLAAADIAADLSANSAGSGGGVPVGGESYKFEKASTKFHLGDNFTTIQTTIDDDELPSLLADGKFIDDDNDEFDYTQKIEMNASVLGMFDDNDYAQDDPTVGFRIASGYNVLNYTITFVDQPLIADLTTTDLPLMGKNYYVLSNATSGSNLILTLLDSATDTILTEGETSNLNVGGKNYEVSISFISSTEVKLVVNGEVTNSLGETETFKLSDGSYVGIKDILYDSKDTGISKVEFSIGSGKLKLTSGSEIQINDEVVNGITSVLTTSNGALTTSTVTLTSIELDWSTDEDTFITEDTSITMPGFEIVKLSYAGMTYPAEEEIEVSQGSSTYIELNDFPAKGTTVDIPLLYGTSGAYTGLGKDADNRLVSTNATTLVFDKDTDAQFVVTYESSTECESYIMKATGFGTDTSSNNKTTLQLHKDGDWKDERDVKAGDTFSVGQAELGVSVVQRSPVNSVVLTANSSNTKFNILCSEEGLKVWLPFNVTHTEAVPLANAGEINFSGTNTTTAPNGHNNATFYLQMAEEDKDENVAAGDQFNISLGWDSSATAEPEVSDLIGEDVTASEIGDSDVFRSFMYSALATEFLYDQPSSSQDSIKIIYHGEEVVADVYLTSPETTIGSGESGVMTVDDTEVSTVSGKSLVVVGGSAINSVAAELLGGAYSEADFTEMTGVGAGEFLIQSFNRNGKTALLVAGYNAADTTKAATYLVNNGDKVDTAVGKKYVGSSATEASLVTA